MKLYETIEKYNNKKINIYFDMDGVIAEYDAGNFDYNTIRPLKSNIEKMEKFNDKKNINTYILSVCKTNNIMKEKIIWLDNNLPFLNKDNIILFSKEKDIYLGVESKQIKSDYLTKNINKKEINIVIDDDIQIIKHLRKNNPDVIVFHNSSLVD